MRMQSDLILALANESTARAASSQKAASQDASSETSVVPNSQTVSIVPSLSPERMLNENDVDMQSPPFEERYSMPLTRSLSKSLGDVSTKRSRGAQLHCLCFIPISPFFASKVYAHLSMTLPLNSGLDAIILQSRR
jgi:hypothetical protein